MELLHQDDDLGMEGSQKGDDVAEEIDGREGVRRCALFEFVEPLREEGIEGADGDGGGLHLIWFWVLGCELKEFKIEGRFIGENSSVFRERKVAKL